MIFPTCSDSYNPVPGVMEGVPASRNYAGGFASKLMVGDLAYFSLVLELLLRRNFETCLPNGCCVLTIFEFLAWSWAWWTLSFVWCRLRTWTLLQHQPRRLVFNVLWHTKHKRCNYLCFVQQMTFPFLNLVFLN